MGQEQALEAGRVIDFATFARDHGLVIRHVIADGRVHRVPTVGHPRKRNGAYLFDGRSGWVQAWDLHAEAIPFRDTAKPTRPVMPAKGAVDESKAVRAAAEVKAREIVERCAYAGHPYLVRKGFPQECGLVDTDGRLVVPMRKATRYEEIVSVQHIAEDGTKRFLAGGAAKDAVHHIGRGPLDILVEGYATGLSVRAAIRAMYQQARVVVCFSAGNLASVARLYKRARVIADHDASGAGEAAARKAGLPWAMPSDVGMDANDLMLRDGIGAVCDLLGLAQGKEASYAA